MLNFRDKTPICGSVIQKAIKNWPSTIAEVLQMDQFFNFLFWMLPSDEKIHPTI